jgi:hypothetical protein
MNIRLLKTLAITTLILGLFTAGRTAHASLDVLEQAYELEPRQIISLPGHAAGRLSIRPCESCEAVVLRADGQTRYYVGQSRSAVSLNDWLAKVADADDELTLFYVFYRDEDKIVTRIVLDTGRP